MAIISGPVLANDDGRIVIPKIADPSYSVYQLVVIVGFSTLTSRLRCVLPWPLQSERCDGGFKDCCSAPVLFAFAIFHLHCRTSMRILYAGVANPLRHVHVPRLNFTIISLSYSEMSPSIDSSRMCKIRGVLSPTERLRNREREQRRRFAMAILRLKEESCEDTEQFRLSSYQQYCPTLLVSRVVGTADKAVDLPTKELMHEMDSTYFDTCKCSS